MKFELFQYLKKMTEKNNNSLMYICHKGKSHFALPILNFLSLKIKLYRSESKYGFIHKIRIKNFKIIVKDFFELRSFIKLN